MPVGMSLPLDGEVDAVASLLESLHCGTVRHVYHTHVVHVGDDVVHLGDKDEDADKTSSIDIYLSPSAFRPQQQPHHR